MCPFPEHQRFRVIRMSRDQVIDIMTYNSYSLQYYSFSERKNRFWILETRGLVPVFWDNANPHQALQFDSFGK